MFRGYQFCTTYAFYGSNPNEINAEDSVKKKGYKFWAYRCPMCLNYHLTKTDRLLAKWINDIAYRNKMREEAFVQRETAYYNKRNNIKE